MKKSEKGNEILNEILYILRTIVICSVAVFLCTKLLFSPIHVDGVSMNPTLKDKDFGFSFVLGALFNNFNRFDVVIVKYEKMDTPWVKRIIGLPGETIEYIDDHLYVNGEYIEEEFFDLDYVDTQTFGGDLNFTEDFGPITLADDEYFLMGDNRLVSQDSRVVGAFKESDILSKYVFVLYPFDHIRLVKNKA